MCCFSARIDRVSKTRIFARVEGNLQTLVYSMDLNTPQDLAMILPIPIQPGTHKIEFIDLSYAADFFEQIEALFPKPPEPRTRSLGYDLSESEVLEVEKVGAYDASFVPSAQDMDRLDRRFAITKDIWDAVPEYVDFGFAVFKLSKGDAERHPMGFRFPTRHPTRLFFPTVHVHDGTLPKQEDFDHTLYAQPEKNLIVVGRWTESKPADERMVLGLKRTITEGRIAKKVVEGVRENKDIYADLISNTGWLPSLLRTLN